MKTVILVGIGMAGISAMVAVAAHGQMDSAASTNRLKAEAVVDAAGNYTFPMTIAPRISFWEAGRWLLAKAKVRRSCMSRMHGPEP